MIMTDTEKKLCELFQELVPLSGKAATVAGEITRAINRVMYRNWNDGDHIGVGYGKWTCNPAARYLQTVCDDEVRALIDDLWGCTSDRLYDAGMELLGRAVIEFIERNPDLKHKPNTEDMFDYRVKEDEEDDEEEEEDCDY